MYYLNKKVYRIQNLNYTKQQKLSKYLKKLNITHKIKNNEIEIYLHTLNVNFVVFILVLLSVVCNLLQLKNAKLKMQQEVFVYKHVALELISVFNNIKNYQCIKLNKEGIDVTGKPIYTKSAVQTLRDEDCKSTQTNNVIKKSLKYFLREYYEDFTKLIQTLNERTKNETLKQLTHIIINKLDISTDEDVIDLEI